MLQLKDGPTLTQEEIEEILPNLDYIQKWAKNLSDYCLKEALAGRKFKGFKLVEGRKPAATLDDPQAVIKAVTDEGYDEVLCYKPKQVISASDFKKLLGTKKYREIVEPHIVQASGSPTLVEESDHRPEYGVNSAVEDFKDDINQ